MALKRTLPDMSNSGSLVTNKSRDYSDIDLSFSPKPGTLMYWIHKLFSSEYEAHEYAKNLGLSADVPDYKVFKRRVGDIYKKVDASAVIQSVGNIILTNFEEKPFDPEFGGDIRSMLFENKESYSESFVRERIEYAIARYEKRAIVESVKFFDKDGFVRRGKQQILDFERNSISIIVEFRLETDGEVYTATVNMNRLR
jgi:phage baseplate assembly protein W